MFQSDNARFVLAAITLLGFIGGAFAEHIRFGEQFEKYKLTACEQQHQSYLQYREQADNRIGLLENYLTTICYNAGYENFEYDKNELFTTRAKCTGRFVDNGLSQNLTFNSLYLELNNKIKNKVGVK